MIGSSPKAVDNLANHVVKFLRYPELFWSRYSRFKPRSYQQVVAAAIIDSVKYSLGKTICVIFPRQSGKNELQAQIESYVLLLLSNYDAEIVKVQPTWKPQALRAMKRLEKVLDTNLITNEIWRKESGYIYRVGKAKIYFLSAAISSHVVGATANVLLEADEAQDINIAKWDKEIAPMAASTNATRVLWGTAWTNKTLLAREAALCKELEKQDGFRRVFRVTADEVSQEVHAYKLFIQGELSKFGRNHPIIKTQYYCEAIDDVAGMFTSARIALMSGQHPAQFAPQAGKIYAMTIDVAGSDETRMDIDDMGERNVMELAAREHDCTAITLFEIGLQTLDDPVIGAITYQVVNRVMYQNMPIAEQHARLRGLIHHWQPYRVAVDSTGVGAGLCSTLIKVFGEKIVPFVFTGKSKSDLAWSFLAIIDTGRFKDYEMSHEPGYQETDYLRRTFLYQCEACQMKVRLGPARLAAWGVEENTRHPENQAALLHDDLLVSAAMCSVFDQETFGKTVSAVIRPADLFEDRRF
jgi:hypothetical protein